MAQYRLLHKCVGNGDRTDRLSDFEYIVWQQYLLSADDFGIMRCSAPVLQGQSRRLEKRPTRHVQKALERAIAVALVEAFDHQDQRYVCQLDWQDYQKIRFPSKTTNPLPPLEIYRRCSEVTQQLYGEHRAFASMEYGENSEKKHSGVPRTLHANANANDLGSLKKKGCREMFAEFWAAYPRKEGKDKAWKAWEKRKPDAALLATILTAIMRQSTWPQWTRDQGQFIPHPTTWLNGGRWQDEEPAALRSLVSDKTRQNIANGPEALRIIENGGVFGDY